MQIIMALSFRTIVKTNTFSFKSIVTQCTTFLISSNDREDLFWIIYNKSIIGKSHPQEERDLWLSHQIADADGILKADRDSYLFWKTLDSV